MAVPQIIIYALNQFHALYLFHVCLDELTDFLAVVRVYYAYSDAAIKRLPQVGRIFLQQLDKLFAVGVEQLAPDILQVIAHDDLNIAVSNTGAIADGTTSHTAKS